MISPASGTLLIAEPFLKDPSFMRSVVLICRHNEEEGTFGFTLNKLLENTLDEIITDLDGYPLPVYTGGPVHMDTLHYIHQYPELLPDAQKVTDNIWWGGDFEVLKSLIKNNEVDTSKIKFFLGYSGWSAGQLQQEMETQSWLTTIATKKIVFDSTIDEIWNASLIQLGGKYKMMINFPTDPQLN